MPYFERREGSGTGTTIFLSLLKYFLNFGLLLRVCVCMVGWVGVPEQLLSPRFPEMERGLLGFCRTRLPAEPSHQP